MGEGGIMEGFSVFHFLVILTVVAFFFFFGGRKFKFPPPPFRGGPPTHPLPVTSPVETSRAAGNPDSSTRSPGGEIRGPVQAGDGDEQ